MLVLEALIDEVLLSAVIFSDDAAQVEISSTRIKASSVFNHLTILNGYYSVINLSLFFLSDYGIEYMQIIER